MIYSWITKNQSDHWQKKKSPTILAMQCAPPIAFIIVFSGKKYPKMITITLKGKSTQKTNFSHHIDHVKWCRFPKESMLKFWIFTKLSRFVSWVFVRFVRLWRHSCLNWNLYYSAIIQYFNLLPFKNIHIR